MKLKYKGMQAQIFPQVLGSNKRVEPDTEVEVPDELAKKFVARGDFEEVKQTRTAAPEGGKAESKGD